MTDPDHKPERVYAVAEKVTADLTFVRLTDGQRYEVLFEHGNSFDILDDAGHQTPCCWQGCTFGGNWTRVTGCEVCDGLNTSCPEGCERDPETGELIGSIEEPHPQAPAAEIGGEVTQAFCNKCGFVGVPDDCGFHHRPKDGVMCNYTAHATPATERPTEPAIAALREIVDILGDGDEPVFAEELGPSLYKARAALAQLNPGDHNDR